MGTWAKRLAAVVAGVAATVAFTAPAFAHVEIEATPNTAGSANAIVTLSAEAESQTAGVVAVQVVLPSGIQPADVALKKGPAGWSLVATADGYRVSGPALAKGTDAVHSITVTRLPAEQSLVFKTTVQYSDGSVDRWIEPPTTDNPNPENEAPVLKLKAGAVAPTGPASPATPSAVSTTAAPVVGTTVVATPAAKSDGDDSGSWLWWLLGSVAVLSAVVLVATRRRRPETDAAESGSADKA